MSSNRIPIAVDIRVRVTEQGSLKGIVSDAQKLQAETGANVKVTANLGETSRSASGSIRGLAFDLRLVSSGLTVLKQELGGVNPVLDGTIGGFRILSAAFSTGLGAMSAVSRATNMIKSDYGGLSGFIASVTKQMSTLTLATGAFAVVAGALLGLAAGTALGEWASGIGAMKSETEDLNQDLQQLQFQMLGLQDVSLGYREDQAMLNMIITQTQYAIEQQGYATAQQTAVLESAQAQTKRLGADNAVLAYQTAQVATQAGLATNQISRYDIMIKDIERGAKEFALGNLFNVFGKGGTAERLSPGQLGGEISRTGPIFAEKGEVMMQKEQLASMIQRGGGGNSQISVSLTFPNAVFATGADVEKGLARGGAIAGAEIRKSMDMDRYRINRRY